jgi:hypothetical protein
MGFGWPKTLPLLGRVISRWIPRDLSLDPVTQHGPDRSLAFLQGAPLIVDFRDAHPGIVGMYAQPACRISPSLAGTDTLRPRHSNWTISSPPPCCRRMWRRKLAGSGMSEAEAAQLWGGSCLLGCTISSQRATSATTLVAGGTTIHDGMPGQGPRISRRMLHSRPATCGVRALR